MLDSGQDLKMDWSKFERSNFNPFITVDINGVTDKLQLVGNKTAKLVMPGDSINIGGGSGNSFRVCISLMLPFAVESDPEVLQQWDITVQFQGGMKPYPEYYVGCLSNGMDIPLTYTQTVPIKFAQVCIFFFFFFFPPKTRHGFKKKKKKKNNNSWVI